MEYESGTTPPSGRRGGFVIGELFVAIFLLALAISSVTALMYSVTRDSRSRSQIDCTAKGAATLAECAAARKAAAKKTTNAARLLVAGCATRRGAGVSACNDSVLSSDRDGAVTVRSRTDSASLELLPKKPRRSPRPDLGFVR